MTCPFCKKQKTQVIGPHLQQRSSTKGGFEAARVG